MPLRADRRGRFQDQRADKLRLLFDATHPDVHDVNTQSVWAAGELLRFGGNFNKFVQSRDLIKQSTRGGNVTRGKGRLELADELSDRPADMPIPDRALP